MKAYINTYDYSCHIEQWHFIHLDYIVEAIKSAEKIFYVYIHREKTMKISDLFHLHYIKRIIRGFIKQTQLKKAQKICIEPIFQNEDYMHIHKQYYNTFYRI